MNKATDFFDGYVQLTKEKKLSFLKQIRLYGNKMEADFFTMVFGHEVSAQDESREQKEVFDNIIYHIQSYLIYPEVREFISRFFDSFIKEKRSTSIYSFHAFQTIYKEILLRVFALENDDVLHWAKEEYAQFGTFDLQELFCYEKSGHELQNFTFSLEVFAMMKADERIADHLRTKVIPSFLQNPEAASRDENLNSAFLVSVIKHLDKQDSKLLVELALYELKQVEYASMYLNQFLIKVLMSSEGHYSDEIMEMYKSISLFNKLEIISVLMADETDESMHLVCARGLKLLMELSLELYYSGETMEMEVVKTALQLLYIYIDVPEIRAFISKIVEANKMVIPEWEPIYLCLLLEAFMSDKEDRVLWAKEEYKQQYKRELNYEECFSFVDLQTYLSRAGKSFFGSLYNTLLSQVFMILEKKEPREDAVVYLKKQARAFIEDTVSCENIKKSGRCLDGPGCVVCYQKSLLKSACLRAFLEQGKSRDRADIEEFLLTFKDITPESRSSILSDFEAHS